MTDLPEGFTETPDRGGPFSPVGASYILLEVRETCRFGGRLLQINASSGCTCAI
jgi:hypothetical protein